MIDVSLDQKQVARILKALKQSPKEVHRAIAVSENRTITFLNKEIAKDVTRSYVIKSRTVKQSLTSKKANSSNLTASVTSEGRSIYLGRFKTARYNRKRKLWAQVKKGAKRIIPGLFRSTPNKLPMHRIGKGRGDIVKPFGPSIPQMIGNKEVLPEIAHKAEEVLNKRIEHELEWRLQKL